MNDGLQCMWGKHMLLKLCPGEGLDGSICRVAVSYGGIWWALLLCFPLGPCCLLRGGVGPGKQKVLLLGPGAGRRDARSWVWIRPPKGRRLALFDSTLKRTPCSYYSPNYWQGFVLGAGGITCLNPFEKSI